MIIDLIWLSQVSPITSDPAATTVGSTAIQANIINWNTIILALIGLLGSLVTAFLSLQLAKIKTATESTQKAAIATADNMDKIHTAVNSERTGMLQLVSDLKDEVSALKQNAAVLLERLETQTRHTATLLDRLAGPMRPGTPP